CSPMRFTRPGARNREGLPPYRSANVVTMRSTASLFELIASCICASTALLGNRGGCRCSSMCPGGQREHHRAENQQHDTPNQVDVHAKRTGINGLISEQTKYGKQYAKDAKHQANWPSNI